MCLPSAKQIGDINMHKMRTITAQIMHNFSDGDKKGQKSSDVRLIRGLREHLGPDTSENKQKLGSIVSGCFDEFGSGFAPDMDDEFEAWYVDALINYCFRHPDIHPVMAGVTKKSDNRRWLNFTLYYLVNFVCSPGIKRWSAADIERLLDLKDVDLLEDDLIIALTFEKDLQVWRNIIRAYFGEQKGDADLNTNESRLFDPELLRAYSSKSSIETRVRNHREEVKQLILMDVYPPSFFSKIRDAMGSENPFRKLLEEHPDDAQLMFYADEFDVWKERGLRYTRYLVWNIIIFGVFFFLNFGLLLINSSAVFYGIVLLGISIGSTLALIWLIVSHIRAIYHWKHKRLRYWHRDST
jgi:hypothetical protein